MAATTNAPVPGLPPEFDGPILLSHLLVNLTEKREQLLILGGPHTYGAIPPDVVAATTHGEGRTQATDAMGPFLSPDEHVSHVDSLAKHAAAFFKMSRSSVTRANSRLSRARWRRVQLADRSQETLRRVWLRPSAI